MDNTTEHPNSSDDLEILTKMWNALPAKLNTMDTKEFKWNDTKVLEFANFIINRGSLIAE